MIRFLRGVVDKLMKKWTPETCQVNLRPLALNVVSMSAKHRKSVQELFDEMDLVEVAYRARDMFLLDKAFLHVGIVFKKTLR